jgi:predicted amidophosphoribosyltransferase
MLANHDRAPLCPFCTNPATWADGRGWICRPCGEPCAPDQDEDGALDQGGSLEPVQGRVGALAGCVGDDHGGVW